MRADRRSFLASIVAGTATLVACSRVPATGEAPMYGLIGKLRAVAGRRDDLAAILLEGVAQMPGCLAYVVALDPSDPDAIWVTEVWDRKDSHAASLSLPSVKDAITRAKPLIAAFDQYIETAPVGGHGLQARA